MNTKKRIFCIALALSLVALTACGGSGSKSQSGAPAQGSGQTQSGGQAPAGSQPAASGGAQAGSSQSAGGERYVFRTAQGTEIAIDDDMAGVLEALGEPQSYFEAESCAFEGLDKTYTYPGFIITTRPDGEQDFISSIRLTDDSVTTPEGLYIGSAGSDVTAVYGESSGDMDNYLTYVQGDVSLNFLLEDGAVTSIEYLPA